jgi:hypothetical protein
LPSLQPCILFERLLDLGRSRDRGRIGQRDRFTRRIRGSEDGPAQQVCAGGFGPSARNNARRKTRNRATGGSFGLLLRRVGYRERSRVFCLRRRRRGPGALLGHMRQFVGDQPITLFRPRPEAPSGERDVFADGYGAGACGERQRRPRPVRVHARGVEAPAESGLHPVPQARWKWPPGGRQARSRGGARLGSRFS